MRRGTAAACKALLGLRETCFSNEEDGGDSTTDDDPSLDLLDRLLDAIEEKGCANVDLRTILDALAADAGDAVKLSI